MNKDELLKIYSAYLPYGLEFMTIKGMYKGNTHKLDSLSFEPEGDSMRLDRMICGTDHGFYLPILYDLSYLTKEIEHKGETFVPTRWLRDNHAEFDISKADMEQLISMFIHVFRSPESAPYYFIKKLLEWHFNVFQLPEDQFINKATLTNK